MSKSALVTGGGGFIGAHLVRSLVAQGWKVRVLDNLTRGSTSRVSDVAGEIEFLSADIRDESAVTDACRGVDVVFHLAAVNGTENFYKQPELVLDVGVRGALAVLNACQAANVPDLIVASSAEVYQSPPIVPTDETVPLSLPDSTNPRYSYGGSKMITELIAFNYGRDHFNKLQVFRPHNVYGPDMGWKHVVPQFITRAMELNGKSSSTHIKFPIQGDGSETRAFAFVSDVVEGILLMHAKGEHRSIYHIGNDHEVSIAELAATVGSALGLDLEIQPGEAAAGGTARRCPDISRMKSIGYLPKVQLEEGIHRTAEWYVDHSDKPHNPLM